MDVGLSSNDYIVSTLSKSYLTVKGIMMQYLFDIDRTILTCLNNIGHTLLTKQLRFL